METREFFFIAFSEPQPLGEQPAEAAQHFTLIGYFRPNPQAQHQFTLAEHLDQIALNRLELPGKKLRNLGRFAVTTLGDPTGELNKIKDELFAALISDGYMCSRPFYYRKDYVPHITVGPALGTPGAPPPTKLKSFTFNNLSVTESRFDEDYNFLGSEVLHTRSF